MPPGRGPLERHRQEVNEPRDRDQPRQDDPRQAQSRRDGQPDQDGGGGKGGRHEAGLEVREAEPNGKHQPDPKRQEHPRPVPPEEGIAGGGQRGWPEDPGKAGIGEDV